MVQNEKNLNWVNDKTLDLVILGIRDKSYCKWCHST